GDWSSDVCSSDLTDWVHGAYTVTPGTLLVCVFLDRYAAQLRPFAIVLALLLATDAVAWTSDSRVRLPGFNTTQSLPRSFPIPVSDADARREIQAFVKAHSTRDEP